MISLMRHSHPTTATSISWRILLSFALLSSTELQPAPAYAVGEGEIIPTRLEAALRATDAAALRKALLLQPDWRDVRIDRKTPLAWAATRESPELIDALLTAGADVDALGEDGFSALDIAAWFGKTDVVRRLIAAGSDANRRTASIHGARPIDHAAREGHVGTLRVLIELGADPNGDTALSRSLSHGQWEAATVLLDAGADPSRGGAMLAAAERAPFDLFERMVDDGGDIHEQRFYGGVLAMACGSLQKVELLVSLGADVNGSKQNGHRAIHLAAHLGALEVAKHLRAGGAELDVAKVDGQRPVDLALRSHQRPFVDWLAEEGVRGSLHLAAAQDDVHAVRTWLDRDPTKVDDPLPGDYGPTPLHLAIAFQSNSAVSTLLKLGAHPDGKIGDVSAMHTAVAVSNRFAISALLKAGADPNPQFAPHRYGTGLTTPLHLAMGSGSTPEGRAADSLGMARLLIEGGADIHLHSELGRTPFSIAMERGSTAWTQLFEARSNTADIPAFYAREAFKVTDDTPLLIRAFKAGQVARGGFSKLPIHAANPKPGDVVADIGCGMGPHLEELLVRVGLEGKVVARDINREAIDTILARKLDRLDAKASTRGDVAIDEQTIDIAILAEVWNALVNQPEREDFVRSLFQAMKPGGIVVITLYGRNATWSRPEWVQEAITSFRSTGFEAGQRLDVRDREPGANPNYVLQFRRPS